MKRPPRMALVNDDDRAIPRAAEEAARAGAPGYRTALLAVAVMILGTGVLALLIYLLMIAIRPVESRDPSVRVQPRPAVQVPTTTSPAAPSPVTPEK